MEFTSKFSFHGIFRLYVYKKAVMVCGSKYKKGDDDEMKVEFFMGGSSA
jgi:hypothetical protein